VEEYSCKYTSCGGVFLQVHECTEVLWRSILASTRVYAGEYSCSCGGVFLKVRRE
jgi:hypothetical protein